MLEQRKITSIVVDRRRAPRRRRRAPARPLAHADWSSAVNLGDSLPFIAALLALLLGLAIGKAWERYKLRDGKWIDRRRARDSHHYVLGLNFLVANQIDLAIEELSQAARVDSDALEIHLILGNVHRERGQVARAIQVHQALLQRPKLTKHRARLHPAVPRPRLQARRLRRSRPRGVQRSAAASIRRISTRCSTCRSCTRSSTSGPTRTASASSWWR